MGHRVTRTTKGCFRSGGDEFRFLISKLKAHNLLSTPWLRNRLPISWLSLAGM